MPSPIGEELFYGRNTGRPSVAQAVCHVRQKRLFGWVKRAFLLISHIPLAA